LQRLKFSNFSLFNKIVLFGSLSSYGVDIEALAFELIMLHELVCTAVVRVALIEDILADLVECLGDVEVECKERLNYLRVDLVVFVVQLLFLDEMEIVWQVLGVPDVVLDFLQGDSFNWIWLQHPIY